MAGVELGESRALFFKHWVYRSKQLKRNFIFI
jgi:hypothetical protein